MEAAPSLATFLVAGDAQVTSWDPAAAALSRRGTGAFLGRPCFDCVAFYDCQGNPVCTPDCPLLALARAGKSAVHQHLLFIHTPKGRRPAFVSNTVYQDPDGGWNILHVVKPLSRCDALTPSEMRVLDLLDRGLDTGAIAREMSVASNTVRTHIRHILAKLDAKSRVEALALIRPGGVGPP